MHPHCCPYWWLLKKSPSVPVRQKTTLFVLIHFFFHVAAVHCGSSLLLVHLSPSPSWAEIQRCIVYFCLCFILEMIIMNVEISTQNPEHFSLWWFVEWLPWTQLTKSRASRSIKLSRPNACLFWGFFFVFFTAIVAEFGSRLLTQTWILQCLLTVIFLGNMASDLRLKKSLQMTRLLTFQDVFES